MNTNPSHPAKTGANLAPIQPPVQIPRETSVLPKTSATPLSIQGAPQPPSILRHIPADTTQEQLQEVAKGIGELTKILSTPLTPERTAEAALREVHQFVDKDPHNAYAVLHEGFLRHGTAVGTVESGGSPLKRAITVETTVQYREALVREYGITTTAEFMLLDMAMAAYSRALYFDAVVGHLGQDVLPGQSYAFADGDVKRIGKIAEMAGRYRAEFRACLKALHELKAPPMAVTIQNAEKVGIVVAGNQTPAGRSP